MNSKRGFTLIEILLVALIMGVLLSIGTYVYNYGTQRARDTTRKNDLFTITMAFEARFKDETCDSQAYPGYNPTQSRSILYNWDTVDSLPNDDTGGYCANFTNYLINRPQESNNLYPYKYNLSNTTDGSNNAKNYRLGAHMENQAMSTTDIGAASSTWQFTFGGKGYYDASVNNYNYFIGK